MSLTSGLTPKYPQLDLDQLHWIFQRHHNAYDSREEWMKAMKDDLIMWAYGVNQKKEWCEHIRWQVRGEGTRHMGEGFWGFGFPHLQNICEGWIVCPMCAKPRPTP